MFFLMEFKFAYRNVITYMVKMKNQKEIKRFAGHSKWANIKRTKMQTDLKKSQLIQVTLKKIKYAVDINKNTDPDENIMLARAIAEAKRNSIPAATITNALKNLTISLNQDSVTYISRGPLNILIILQLLSNQAECRLKINSQLKKLGFSSCEIPKAGLLNKEGVILTEQLYSYQEEEKIIEDAIEVDAADAKIIKKNNEEFCQFTCSPSNLSKVLKELEKKNYKIIDSEINYSPQRLITLTGSEMQYYQKICDKFNSMEEVIKVNSNVT